MKSDREIQKEVMLELQHDPAISSENIGIAVEDGIVTLTGMVPRYADKYSVEKRTLAVHGVKGVVESLRVSASEKDRRSDEALAEAAYQALRWNLLVPETVKVTISSGIATLSGSVDWAYQSKAAVDVVRHLSGIVDVNNEITVSARAAAPDIRRRIEAALLRSAGDDAKNIKVEVKDGKVKLSGRVTSEKEFKDAKWAAWSAPGVCDVDNQLLIVRS